MEEDIKVENVVASVHLHKKIPLMQVAKRLKNTEYDPEQFPGLVLRLEEPDMSALVFSSGRIVCTGAKNRDEVERAVEEIIKQLGEADVKIDKEPTIEIQNMVGAGSLGTRLDLNKLIFELEYAEYEPEQFPGLVYKLPNSNVTFLLFGTGKIVCTGAKYHKEIDEAVNRLKEKIKEFKEK